MRFARGRRAVGFAPQQIALYPWLTPRENCFAFGRLSGLSRRDCDARVGPVLRLTGCEPVAQTPVSRLSGGYQRRANIAAALMNDPELLILDEPTAGLDAEGRVHVATAIDAVRAAGAAIVLVTHDFRICRAARDQGRRAGRRCPGLRRAPAELIAERFGAGERADFALKDAPDAAGLQRLAALGAEPTGGDRAFRLRRPRAAAQEIEAAGFPLAEWRVRPMGLEDLFAASLNPETAA